MQKKIWFTRPKKENTMSLPGFRRRKAFLWQTCNIENNFDDEYSVYKCSLDYLTRMENASGKHKRNLIYPPLSALGYYIIHANGMKLWTSKCIE